MSEAGAPPGNRRRPARWRVRTVRRVDRYMSALLPEADGAGAAGPQPAARVATDAGRASPVPPGCQATGTLTGKSPRPVSSGPQPLAPTAWRNRSCRAPA